MNIQASRAAMSAVALASVGLLLAGCSSSTDHADMPGMTSPTRDSPSTHDMGQVGDGGGTDSMSGMPMAHGAGLRASAAGYTLKVETYPHDGMAMPVRFVITRGDSPVTDFQVEQTKKLHLYLVRDDLTGFQHLHPTMAADGTWSVTVPPVEPGRYRVYTQILPTGRTEPLVLSVPFRVAGTENAQSVPGPSTSTTVDGYTVTLGGPVSRGRELTVSFAKDGKPVTDLQPYLDTYAHITAFHQGDLAFTHLHPTNPVTTAGGGPDLGVMVDAPETGTYRLFIQFMTGGKLHTAAITTVIS